MNANLKQMSTYVLIIRDAAQHEIAVERLQATFPDFKELAPNAWVLKAVKPSEDISQALFPRDAEGKAPVSHVVFLVTSWWGFHSRNIWEWLNLPPVEEKNDQ
jgi:hypothetical protein